MFIALKRIVEHLEGGWGGEGHWVIELLRKFSLSLKIAEKLESIIMEFLWKSVQCI